MTIQSPEPNDTDVASGDEPLITIRNARKWFPIKGGMFSPVKAHAVSYTHLTLPTILLV